MRVRIAAWVVIGSFGLGSGCGSSGEPTESELVEDERPIDEISTAPADPVATTPTTPSTPSTPSTPTAPAVPSCDRVRPCIEAFVAVVPDSLAGPARIALAQLDTSLAESTAREPACAAAIASYRHDLETLDLDVPETCR